MSLAPLNNSWYLDVDPAYGTTPWTTRSVQVSFRGNATRTEERIAMPLCPSLPASLHGINPAFLSLSLAFLCTNSILVRRSPTSLGVWCQSSAHVLRISALDMRIPNRTPGAATNMLECGGAAFRPWKSRSATQNRSISPIPSARGCVVHGCYKLAYCIWDTKWVQTFACNHSLCCYTS
jgi:hypothetical protein